MPGLSSKRSRVALTWAMLLWAPTHAGSSPDVATMLEVPVVRQARQRCGQAALEMVLRYYGADGAALREGERAYDPVLRGSLITDLAEAAGRAGYPAQIATLTADSLVALLATDVPPIVLYQTGRRPLTRPHFGVLTGWDPAREVFTIHDGGSHPRIVRRGDLANRWRTAGSLALGVRRRMP